MDGINVSYQLYSSPRVERIRLTIEDLSGSSTVLEFLAAWHGLPPVAEIQILDILPSL